MDIFFLVVTVVSLVAAFVAMASVYRMKKSEQTRSDARVAALAAAADETPVSAFHAATGRTAPHREGTWTSVAGEWQWNPPAAEPRDEQGRDVFAREATFTSPVPGGAARSVATGIEPQATEQSMFGTVQRESPAWGRFAFAGALALVALLGLSVAIFSMSSRGKASASAAQAAHADPLELVALGHAREANLLTITGMVRNPANGPKLEGLTAVVSLIDGHGGLISTKDVPLDYRALGPGEEAPFKLTVPDPGSVVRYRVSFRAGTDIVPHVDRRTDTKLASAL